MQKPKDYYGNTNMTNTWKDLFDPLMSMQPDDDRSHMPHNATVCVIFDFLKIYINLTLY